MKHPVVVVTGASAGLGRAIAHRFAQEGARLELIARDGASLQDVKAEVAALGGEASTFTCDVANASAVFSAAEFFERQLGPIDIWINNAMLTVFSPICDMTPDEFRRVTEVTYLGGVHGVMAALRCMRPRNKGSIIQIGSALAYRGIPLQAAYCGAKHALRGFVGSLRSELIHEKSDIRVTMVQLPAINTTQFSWARAHTRYEPRPVAPVFEPEAIAEAIYKATIGGGREYWVGLSTLEAIFGNGVAPALLDYYLGWFGYRAQEREAKVARDRPDNLYSPVTRLHSTRGPFGREARNSVRMISRTQAHLAVIAASLGAAGAVWALARSSLGRPLLQAKLTRHAA